MPGVLRQASADMNAPRKKPLDMPSLSSVEGGVTSAHIFPTSATMLGVCMTVLSLSRLDDQAPAFWLIDKLVAMAAIIFLISCFVSFLSLRLGPRTRVNAAALERRAEYAFMLGIAVLATSAVLLAIAIG